MATPFSRTTRALALDSPRLALAALAIAGLFLLAWLAWFALSNVSVYAVSRQARVEVGSAPRDVSTVQAGRLAATGLVIGRQVHSGDVLVELDATAQNLKLAEVLVRQQGYPRRIAALRREVGALRGVSSGDGEATAAGVQSAQARVAEANAAAGFAQDLAVRQQAESESGGSARIDAARAAADASKAVAARNALAADVGRIALDARTRGAQNEAQIAALAGTLVGLQIEMATAEQEIAQLRLDIENRQVRAPIDGVIAEVQALQPGAFVTAGQKLATIVPDGDLLVVAAFDPATALGRLKPGQHAQLLLDGFPWAQYGSVTARVLRVASEIRDGSLRVELKVAGASSHNLALRHGMTGRVNVTIEQASPAMLLLRSAGQAVQ